MTTRLEAKQLKKKKLNSKLHWVRSEGDNLRSDLVNWDDIVKEVAVRKNKNLRTCQSSEIHTGISSQAMGFVPFNFI